MARSGSNRLVLTAVLALAGLFVAANIIHSLLQSDYWIFQAWRFTPLWYLLVWGAVTIASSILVWCYHDRVLSALGTTRVHLALLIGLIGTIAIFHYDSFVFGDGNLRVAQIAQSDTLIISPWEYGSVALVAGLFKLLNMFGLAANTAGVWAWRLYSFGCSALAIWGALRFAQACTKDAAHRVLVTAVVVFTGPFLMLCGYIGVEPVIVPTVIWFSVAAYRLSEKRTIASLGLLWGTVALGMVMTISSAFLLPAAVGITVASLLRSRKNWLIGGLCGLATMAVAFLFLYYRTEQSMALARLLVLPNGKLPLTAYTLVSWQNIIDKALVFFAVIPIGIAILVLLFRRLAAPSDRIFAMTAILALIGGRLTHVALDPTFDIVLDLPRLTAYLTPFGVAFAFYLDRRAKDGMITPRTMALIAVLTVLLPLAGAPIFTKIKIVDPLAEAMALRHDYYYRTTALAFRDAYFYDRDLNRANAWEQSLPIRSPDFLNMRGCYDLAAGGRNRDALVSLYRLVGRQPYWAEPRALLATLQLKLGQADMARPHVDTCLMLDPYNVIHMQNHYRYFQTLGNFDTALTLADDAGRLYPRDTDIATDIMIIALQAGQTARADSLASGMLASDTTHAYPHLIRGRIAEKNGQYDSAVVAYRRFLRYAPPGNPDIEIIGKRLEALRTMQHPAEGH
ncbi:MAG: hypothetical protein HY851_10910 [candidate division Zixibacteria bacterium]|nr:hypothetical protein [candidate division Zixibacteria bacterium]